MHTKALERLGIKTKVLADGPHGIRREPEENCTHFPNLCCAGASWDTDLMYEMGEALGEDCIAHNVDMLLGPGINIKRNIECGRNFEYISEDPILSGEMAAAYINGLQSKGVGASLKHFALNNQEKYRTNISVELDICKALCAGLDLQMPPNFLIAESIRKGMENGEIDMEIVDHALENVFTFLLKERPSKVTYDREKLHLIARKMAAAGTVLLKNENNVLPLNSKKYKKIAVLGEYAKSPLIGGQGSAEVFPNEKYIESPLDELKKALGEDVEIIYQKTYEKRSYSDVMLWPKIDKDFLSNADAVILFVGAMESEDTEQFDRRSVYLNPNQEMFIRSACGLNKNVIVVVQSGGALIFGEWTKMASGIIQMWLGGEAAGGAIADILTGKVNPSGKLSETFPLYQRKDLEYRGDGLKIAYKEGFEIGYRYYDAHPDEIAFPFGHGLSYSEFVYNNLSLCRNGNEIEIKFNLENISEFDGAEVVQIYVGKETSFVTRSEKELKLFKKVFLKANEKQEILLTIDMNELAYYNSMIRRWVVEPGEYTFYIASSSRDIRLTQKFLINEKAPYSITAKGEAMIG